MRVHWSISLLKCGHQAQVSMVVGLVMFT